MDTSKKRSVDLLGGRLLCFLFIPLTLMLGILLRRDHSMTRQNVRTILVAKFMGLGSIVHSLPMLRAIKDQYPDAELIFLTRQDNLALFQHMPVVDDVLCVDDSNFIRFVSSHLRVIYSMVRRRVDIYFDLELFSFYGALMSLFSMARNRMGFFYSRETDFKTLIYTHLMFFNFFSPIRVSYLQLARLAHVAADQYPNRLGLHLDHELVRHTREKLADLLGRDQYRGILALNVNASDLNLARRWPGKHFADVARHFAAKGYVILFVGSPGEKRYVQSVMDLAGDMDSFPGRMFNVAGYFDLSELLAVLTLCDVVLTNDTGIMNFCYGLGVRTLSLFGPSISRMYHVPAPNTRVIEKPVYCRPCLYHLITAPCKGNNVCMWIISPGEVIEALEDLMSSKTAGPVNKPVELLTLDGEPLGTLRTRKPARRKKGR